MRNPPRTNIAVREDHWLPYQYVVLRCVPRVDRQEFFNVGVVLFSQEADYLAARCHLDEDRALAFAPGLDLAAVRGALAVVDAVCAGEPVAGLPADARIGRRFGWLSAPRSTVIQPSAVHGGLAHAPSAELDRLLTCLVR